MKARITILSVTVIMVSTLSACSPAQTPTESIMVPINTQTSTSITIPALIPTNTPQPIPTIPTDEEFHVNPIDVLSPDFLVGADVSMLGEIEKNGGKYFDQGVEGDALEIIKNHGVNWIRFRIWNDPTDGNSKPLGGGNNDLERTVELATKAKSLIENIVVTNEQCTISLKVASGGGTWGFFDDAGLFLAESK